MATLWLGVVSLFPEMFKAVTEVGITGRAITNSLAKVSFYNPRSFAIDRHGTVDNKPFGGGPGMVLMVPPVRAAINAARADAPPGAPVICLSPQGKKFNQGFAEQLSKEAGLILLAGRYDGFDERILERDVDLQISVGDYVLSGGELPAMTLMDAIIRILPEALGDAESAAGDSISSGLLAAPQYTRPREVGGQRVPEVLLSGNHEQIRNWRHNQALLRTTRLRPDLLPVVGLSSEAAGNLGTKKTTANTGEQE